jgi:aquaporin Z
MQAYLVEYLGTVFFLYVIIASGGNAAVIGAALALAIFLGGAISGGNFNPAVTLLMVLAGKQPASTAAPYVVAQLLAALTVQQLYTRLKR